MEGTEETEGPPGGNEGGQTEGQQQPERSHEPSGHGSGPGSDGRAEGGARAWGVAGPDEADAAGGGRAGRGRRAGVRRRRADEGAPVPARARARPPDLLPGARAPGILPALPSPRRARAPAGAGRADMAPARVATPPARPPPQRGPGQRPWPGRSSARANWEFENPNAPAPRRERDGWARPRPHPPPQCPPSRHRPPPPPSHGVPGRAFSPPLHPRTLARGALTAGSPANAPLTLASRGWVPPAEARGAPGADAPGRRRRDSVAGGQDTWQHL